MNGRLKTSNVPMVELQSKNALRRKTVKQNVPPEREPATVSRIAGVFLRAMARVFNVTLENSSSADVRKAENAAEELVSKVALELSKLSASVALVDSSVGGIAEAMEAQDRQIEEIAGQIKRLTEKNISVAGSKDGMNEALVKIDQAIAIMEGVAGKVLDVNASVKIVENEFSVINKSLAELLKIAHGVDEVAFQTHILSINAALEAAHVGTRGKGFAVVAEEVRRLAERSSDSARKTKDDIKSLVDKIGKDLSLKIRDAYNITEVAGREAGSLKSIFDDVRSLIRSIGADIDVIYSIVQTNMDELRRMADIVESISAEVHKTTTNVSEVKGSVSLMFEATEEIMRHIGDSGALIPDTPYIEKVKETASLVSEFLEKLISNGKLSPADIFLHDSRFDADPSQNPKYALVSGSNPPQYMAPYTGYVDREFQAHLDDIVNSDNSRRIRFCAIQDRSSYLSTHYSGVSNPQKGPKTLSGRLVWDEDVVKENDAKSRNHRFFTDNTGRKLASNNRGVLIQTYRRIVAGQQIIMKDVSYPIFVKGRHFGAVRLGYALD